jgi:hypothetical protein
MMNAKAAPSALAGTSPKYDRSTVVFGGGRVGVETTVINQAQPEDSAHRRVLFTCYFLLITSSKHFASLLFMLDSPHTVY